MNTFETTKQTIDKTEEIEQKDRRMADAMPQIVWFARPDGYLDYYNRRWFEYTGMTLEETIGWGWQPVLHPDDVERCFAVWSKAVETGEPYEIEYRFKRASDGQYRWHLGRALPMRDRQGKIIKWCGTCTDIDDQKKAENELSLLRDELEARVILRTNELSEVNASLLKEVAERKIVEAALEREREFLSAVFESVTDGIAACDAEGVLTLFNRATRDLHGLPEEPISADKWAEHFDLYLPDGETLMEKEQIPLFRALAEGSVRDAEIVIKPKNASARRLIASGQAIFDAHGNKRGAVVGMRDITEQRVIENALRESEAQTRELIVNAKDTIYTMDLSGNFTSLNPAGERLTGYTEAEALQMNIADVISPDAAKLMRRRMASNINGAGLPDFELELILKSGDEVVVGISSSLIVKNGKPVGIQGIGRDITERKKAEIQLKNSEQFNRSIFENSPDCVKVLELDGTLNSMNANGLCVMEIDDFKPFVGEVWVDFWEGEEHKAAHQVLEDARNGKSGKFEGFCKTAKGTMKYWDVSVAPIFDATGQPCRLISTSRDITERKRAEEAKALLAAQLETERTRLVAAQSVAKVGSWETDLVTLAVNWSAETFHIFELDPNQFQPDHRGFLQFVHPDDQAAVTDAFAKSFDKDSVCSFEHRILLAAGKIKFIEERWEIRRDEQGKPLQAVGTCQDITERKLFENALLESERKLFQIMDAMPVGVFVIDSAGKPYFANQAAQHILGEGIMPDVTTDKLGAIYNAYSAGTNQLYPADRMPVVLALKGEKVVVSDMEIHRQETVIPLEVWAAPIYETDGTISYAIAAFKDITEQKRTEAESRVVFEITQGIATTSDLDDLLELVHQSISQAIYAENFYVALYDKRSELLFIPFCKDEFDAVAPPQKLGKGLTAYVFRRGIATLLTKKDIEQLVEQESVALVGTPPAIWLGTPLRTPSEIIGVLVVQHYTDEQAYNQRDLEFLTSIGDQIAQAIERKRAEEKLLQLSSIVESSDDAIISKDLDGVITSWNKGAEHLYGYTAQEMVGKNIFLLVPPGREEEETQILEKIKRGESIEHYETVRMRKDGSLPDLSLTISPLRNVAGEIIGAAKIAHDVTERKQMTVELERARDAALESARLKSEFLANMSHEIRTPMNGVIGMTGLLLDTNLDEEQREFTETVRTSADSLLTIINDILDFSKIEAGHLHFEKLDFDLRNVVESTVGLLAERAQDKKIELLSLVDSDVPTLLSGDAGRIKQVLLNLTGNAVKFTAHGEVAVRVEKEAESETHATVCFTVTDTGIGISEEEQSRLFQAFVQADGSTTRKYGGTGLGLAISKQIVEQMGGEIGIKSEPEKGSTFWFKVSLEKQSAASAAAQAPQPRADLHNLRVLIVDDNATNRKILVHQTASWGMIPVEAESGAAALRLLRASMLKGELFDVALLDLMMPDMNGFDLAQAVKADAQLSNLRLVLMPSFGQRGDGAAAREIGIAAYLMKPVKQSQLFDCLATVMGESGASDDANVLNGDSTAASSNQLVTRHSLEENKFAARTRILIAEDNPVNQIVSKRQVEHLGYRADVVENGVEALAALSKISYDIVLMDCQMPQMDGYETTAEIRRREEGTGRRTVIIAMTANALEGESEKCFAAGMDDYISKPVNVEELRQMLAHWQVSTEMAEQASSNGNANSSVEQVAAPVNIERLRDASNDDEEMLQELIELYLEQMSENIEKLKAAVEADEPDELKRIAHTSIGSSATCGMDAVVPLLRQLEQTNYANLSIDAPPVIKQVEEEFERIKVFLEESASSAEIL